MSRRPTRNQLLRQIADVRAALTRQIELASPVPPARIGVEVDGWPLEIKLAMIEAYERINRSEVDTLDELPLDPAVRAEVERLLEGRKGV
jgi:hypothetical protein